MNILFSFLFILCAVYGLYRVSEKQMKKTLQSKWVLLAHHPQIVRVISLLLLVIATVLIIQEDGYSIGFVSFLVFSSPLIFIFILYINQLSTKQK
mgnify:FL=1